MNSSQLQKAYKQTEVGIIPRDWEVMPLNAVSETSSGTTPPRKLEERYYNGSIPWVKTLDLNNSNILTTDERVTEAALKETSLRCYPSETVLVAMYGGFNQIGRTGILIKSSAVNQAITAIRTNRNKLAPRYLIYNLNYRVDYWKNVASSSRKDPNITGKDIREFLIACPPLLEQEAIAQALSDADVLIESLEQLIAKKRQIKQGAMQELLTGKRRLPGFSGEWNQINLGDILTFRNGLNKDKRFFGYGTPIVNYMDVFTNNAIYSSHLQGRVFLSNQEIKNFDVKKGDILFTRTSETPEEIGMAAVILDEPIDTVFSGFVLRGRPKDERLCNEFKAYCFRSAYVRAQIVSKASYTTRALTNGQILSSLLLLVPTKPEQIAIATVLSEMDAEISVLGAKLSKARQIKQGMMQELLTGRIRLV